MRKFEGIITSTKMNNTIVVEVERRTPHPLYKKLIKRGKNFKVDSNGQTLEVGQRVRIVETRPMSKGKFFKVDKIINVGKGNK